MEAFHWDSHYETGLDEVDSQHYTLVEKINLFGEAVSSNQISDRDLAALITDLKDYAAFHFKEEENLMLSSALDQRGIEKHFAAHRAFIEEIERLSADIKNNTSCDSSELLNILSRWLAYHILGEDQCMARQMSYIQEGSTPQQAYTKALQNSSEATEPLLDALLSLFNQVSERNKELVSLNECLEEQVAERTKELQKSNSNLEEANKNLKELALTDSLTSLPNRRHAMRILSTLWGESKENNREISCMMIDADHFKKINDTFGHDCGDTVLQQLSATLNNAVRTDDIVARLGGDEFFIICPNTGLNGANIVANQVLSEINGLSVKTGTGHWKGSISIGVAVRLPSMTNYGELIKAADNCVYQAKNSGKNCIRLNRNITEGSELLVETIQ